MATHKYENVTVRECSFCHRSSCDGSAFSCYSSHEPNMREYADRKSAYYCDACGQKIEFDESEKGLFGFRFLGAVDLGMDEENAAHSIGDSGNYHFHKKCFEERVKPHLLRRVKLDYGREEFALPTDADRVVDRLALSREEGG